jgi:hypothetical protein
VQAGTVDVSVVIRIIDSADGTPETGVVFNTATSTAITEATLAALTTAHTDGGFLHIGNGYYRLDLPDAACGAGAVGVLVHGTVTGMIVIGEYIELIAYNPQDAANLGLSTLSTLLSRIVGTLATGTHQPQSGDAYARLGAPVGASISADVAGVQSDTDNIQTRLPAALVSGRMDSSVGAMATDTLTSGALAASAVTEIQSGLSTLTAAQAADAVWDETLGDHLTAGSTGAALNAAGSAGDPWGTALPGAYGAGSAGNILGNNLNATVSSRSTQTSVDTIVAAVDTEVAAIKAKTDQLTFTTANKVDSTIQAAADFAQGAADQVWLSTTRTLTALSTALAVSVWDVLESAITTASSLGLKLKTNVDATISSRSTYAGADTAGTTTLLSRIIGTLATGTHQPQSGDSYARLGAPAGASISADIGTRASQTSVDGITTAVDTEVAAIKAKTDQLTFTGANRVDASMAAIDNDTSAATNLKFSADTMVRGTVDTTGFTPTTTEFEAGDVTEATADHYLGLTLKFTSGALSGQGTAITDYSLVGGRGHFTVVALTEPPASTDTFVML